MPKTALAKKSSSGSSAPSVAPPDSLGGGDVDPLLSVSDSVSGSGAMLQGGNDMVHYNVARGSASANGGAQLDRRGLRANAAMAASGEVFGANAGGGLALGDANNPLAQAEAQGSVKVLAAQAKANAHATADLTKGEFGAGASGSVGAHLAKAEGKAKGGFKIPFTNIMLGGEVSGGAELGVGASGEASAGYSEEEGFHAKLGGSASLLAGLGGSIGLSVRKANKDAGWF